MERRAVRELFDGNDCSVAHTVELIGDKWSLLILREAFYDVRRFEEFRANLGVSRAVLTDRLGALVAHGLIERTPYREEGRRQQDEYRLTEAGVDLIPAFVALLAWGDKHRTDGTGPVELIHQGCGARVAGQLVCVHGHEVSPQEIEPRLVPASRRARRR